MPTYYKLILNSYEKKAGVISSPDRLACPQIIDGREIPASMDFSYELQNGEYCHFDLGPHKVHLVDENLKNLLEAYSDQEFIEYLPVLIQSREFGNRQYFIVHFKKIYDVTDEENSTYDPPGWITKLCVDYNKVKDLHVFNSGPNGGNLIISSDVYKEMKKRRLTFGISFCTIPCKNKDKYIRTEKSAQDQERQNL